MRFRLQWTSDREPPEELELNSLEELVAFVEHNGRVIVDIDEGDNDRRVIEVYDDYRE